MSAFEAAADLRAVADQLDTASINWHDNDPTFILDAWEENQAEGLDEDGMTQLLAEGPAAVRDDVEGYAHALAETESDTFPISCGCPLEES